MLLVFMAKDNLNVRLEKKNLGNEVMAFGRLAQMEAENQGLDGEDADTYIRRAVNRYRGRVREFYPSLRKVKE